MAGIVTRPGHVNRDHRPLVRGGEGWGTRDFPTVNAGWLAHPASPFQVMGSRGSHVLHVKGKPPA